MAEDVHPGRTARGGGAVIVFLTAMLVVGSPFTGRLFEDEKRASSPSAPADVPRSVS